MTSRLDELIVKFGGTFRFTTLLIRRARELTKGMPKLTDLKTNDPIEIAIEEFASGKIIVVGDEVEVKEIEKGT